MDITYKKFLLFSFILLSPLSLAQGTNIFIALCPRGFYM